MSENSKIEWTDHTFNPWEGCQKVGPGCDHCYAETRNARFSGGTAINWGPGAPRRRTSPANWRKPLAWNAAHERFYAEHGRRQRVFCASLADVFDNAVSVQWRYDLLRLIMDTPNLDWLLLTKRIGNAAGMLEQAMRALTIQREGWRDNYLPNVWIGATIVNQAEADRDIPKLLATPAAVRFLSMEPLLGQVDISRYMWPVHGWWKGPYNSYREAKAAGAECGLKRQGLVSAYARFVDWVIVGGESGPGARPMHPDWARSLRDQCAAAGVPFLFKQWGEWTPEDWGERAGYKDTAGVLPSGDHLQMSQGYVPPFDCGERLKAANYVRLDGRTLMDRVGKKLAGRLLDGVQHDGISGGSMKLFTVEISVTAVVMAESEKEAHSVARFDLTDIVRDSDPDIDVQGEIKALDRLPASWDPMCLPYGGDGETRLKDLLPETEPVRDTRTIDMFESQGA